MRCLVTGASGFLGSHLVRKLLGEGHEVLAVVRRSSDLWRISDLAHELRLAYAPLNNLQLIAEDIQAYRPETVFHLAWTGGNSRRYLNDASQVFDNVPGSLELMRLAHQAGCSQYVFLGSVVEYGPCHIPVRETDIPEPGNLYGLAKLTTLRLSEALCAQFGMRFCGVRLFWAYGPMDEPLRMIPSVINNLLAGKRPSLTPGEQLWDFLYVEDAVRALVALAQSDSVSGVFNLGSGAPLTIRNMVTQIRDAIDPALDLGFGDVPYPPGQVMHLEADISRLKAATGWTPEISLPEGIRRTLAWYKSHTQTSADFPSPGCVAVPSLTERIR
jgi:nucleoside-diphosphate-sugar epimerase